MADLKKKGMYQEDDAQSPKSSHSDSKSLKSQLNLLGERATSELKINSRVDSETNMSNDAFSPKKRSSILNAGDIYN